MKIEIIIDDYMLDEPVRKAVAQAVHVEVRNRVDKLIHRYQDQINEAVDVYLAKKLTDDKLKDIINTEVNTQLKERIERLTEED
jgi:hypothetical protein